VRIVPVVALLAGCDAVFLDRSALDDCPDYYAQLPGEVTFHRIVPTTASWTMAEADCLDDTADGITHLAVIDRFTEIDSIHTQSTEILWVGYARDLAADPKTFYTVTGDVLPEASSLWAGMEPSNADGNEVVVELEDRGFNDNNEDVKHRYVCECDGKRATRAFDFVTP